MSEIPFVKAFSHFAPPVSAQTPPRRAVTAAQRRPEEECLPPLLAAARFEPALKNKISATARRLVEGLRKSHRRPSAVEALVQEYALSSAEGVALMCLAEALLRIPDNATRDALIRDKIAGGDWLAHSGKGHLLFANAAAWGLFITGKILRTEDKSEKGLSAALAGLIARFGAPLIRKTVAAAINMMGSQFVRGETIEAALRNSKPLEAQGFRYSYDMLGEAAMTAADAKAYYDSYEQAIHAIGAAAKGKGIYGEPGISIKLSALHPRYSRAQAERVMAELLPRVRELACLARRYDIGMNIDAEEADRLELSLDILDGLLFDKKLRGWDGIGFVVQAYGRRCPFALDYIIDAARRSKHRVMLRLVKGAYWDSEIKRAQIDGLVSYPVYTRKVFTDISYIACAKKLLGAPDAVFPQFATHNAQTLATIYHLAGGDADYRADKYEFQCLHGMGEPLYAQVTGADKLGRPARIYAPVGSYETLLAYLVRRLLENGANSSFVHRIADKAVSVEELIADPADIAAALPNLRQNSRIAAPSDIFLPKRQNSAGLDLSDETVLAELSAAFAKAAEAEYYALPSILLKEGEAADAAAKHRLIAGNSAAKIALNPADKRDIIGHVLEANAEQAAQSLTAVSKGALAWAKKSAAERAAILAKAADIMQSRRAELLALCCREAGKSIPNAVAELREAVDFLRFYGADAERTFGEEQQPLGSIVCISPWNFPLSIFIGQISAALAAGNGVAAKPAEETPLTAALAVEILWQAGVPRNVLQFVPGDGAIGAALAADKQTAGVVFTGSAEAARSIQAELAKRLSGSGGKPPALIAETGGLNALIVDSSALAEQVTVDCIASAFDSAGQRCSALRLLCLQEEIADRIVTMLKGALAELSLGRTDFLRNDIGPVITAEAAANINRHIEDMRAKGYKVTQMELKADAAAEGSFVAPAIIEIPSAAALTKEVFGPVLHIVRYKRGELPALLQSIKGSGYGLTFGLHTRLSSVMNMISAAAPAGNIYINRNIIGAVVGSQPFGGRGLSGTGPKAGGLLYAGRLAAHMPEPDLPEQSFSAEGKRLRAQAQSGLKELAEFARAEGLDKAALYAEQCGQTSLLGLDIALPGPAGEENRYILTPLGVIYAAPQSREGLLFMLSACLSTGNRIALKTGADLRGLALRLPRAAAGRLRFVDSAEEALPACAALLEGEDEPLIAAAQELAALAIKGKGRNGALIPVQAVNSAELRDGKGADPFALNLLLKEVSISNNIVAVGGNPKLMNLG